MLQILGIIVLAYIILQTFYTGYFLVKSQTLVKTIFVGEKTLGNEKNPKFNLFVDGDSVGAGVGASAFEKSVAGRVAEFYAEKNYVHFLNNSISGSRMKDLVDKKLPEGKQNTTLLIISSNDLFHFTDLASFQSQTGEILDRYSANTDKLILIGPGRLFDTTALPFFMRIIYRQLAPAYAKVISEEAKKHANVIYVNPLNVSVSRVEYGDTNAADGFHPNDEGHRFWFDLLRPHL